MNNAPKHLSEKEARDIIGEKMLKRIDLINKFCKNYGYQIYFHSTSSGCVDGIFDEGLRLYCDGASDRRSILQDTNISRAELFSLEKEVLKNSGKKMKLLDLFETYLPGKATTHEASPLTAKDLLEYNHKGGDCTIILCVPKKPQKRIGESIKNEFQLVTSRIYDPYLRTQISCKQGKDGDFEYEQEYFYPTAGILCAFDRIDKKIKLNSKFDETYYLDRDALAQFPERMQIKIGDLFAPLKQIASLPVVSKNGGLGK